MIYVYAPSMSIIVWAAKRWLWEEIIIMSYNTQIAEFCRKTEINFLPVLANRDSSLNGLNKYRRYIKNIGSKINNSDIYFGHNSHDYWGLYLMQLLMKSNNVYYFPQLKEHTRKPILKQIYSPKARRLILDKLVLFLITKRVYDTLEFNGNYFIGMNVKRIHRKYLISDVVEDSKVFQVNKNAVIQFYNLTGIKYVLIDQGEVFYNYTKELIEFLIKFSKKQECLYLKQHPSFPTKNRNLLEKLPQICTEVPIELVDNDCVFIGISSNAIKNHRKSISLLDLVGVNNETRENYKVFLANSFVTFPNSVEEFNDTLLSFV